MTEEEAEAQVCGYVSRETADRLHLYVVMLREEAALQNLISASTLDHIWERHVLDSAQLVTLADSVHGSWIDIGSGAGLPGIVVAALRAQPAVLIEPRAKRAAFLKDVIAALKLESRVQVIGKSAASAPTMQAGVISARAVASLNALFTMGQHFVGKNTLWVLPKGRSAADELAAAQASWQGDFRLVPSQTDSSASIVVARGVRPRK